jgi:hypothetical protein
MLAHPDSKLILNDNIRSSTGNAMLDRDKGLLSYVREGATKVAHFERAHIKLKWSWLSRPILVGNKL